MVYTPFYPFAGRLGLRRIDPPNVRQAMTDAGVRKVPIHPDLAPIVERQTKNKKLIDYLMHRAAMRMGRERSAPPPPSDSGVTAKSWGCMTTKMVKGIPG